MSGTGKWVISERRNESTSRSYPIENWPWLLTYPNGDICYCLSFNSAVDLIKSCQRQLRYEHANFERLKRRNLAGSIRARLVSIG